MKNEADFLENMLQEQAEELGATVLFDDHGAPILAIAVPRFNLEDFDPMLGSGPHPAFIRADGSLRDKFYAAYDVASTNRDYVFNMPGLPARGDVTFDEARALCSAMGPGWHLTNAWEWSAMVMWILMQGRNPFKYSLIEWIDGMKMVDGAPYYPNVNDIGLPESEWPLQGIYIDADRDEHAVLSDTVEHYLGPKGSDAHDNYGSVVWSDMGIHHKGYDALPETTKLRVMQIMLAPSKRLAEETSGIFYFRNYGERFPLRGGDWSHGANAGLAYLALSNRRANSDYNIGFRPAFVEDSGV
jgi:hypothetical protein